jgi:hypothetical protein
MIYASFHKTLVCTSFDDFLVKTGLQVKLDNCKSEENVSCWERLTPREERLLQEVRLAFNVGRRMVVCNHNDDLAYIIQPWQAHYEEVYGIKPPKATSVASVWINPLGNSRGGSAE